MKNNEIREIQKMRTRPRMPLDPGERILQEDGPDEKSDLKMPILRFRPTAWAKLLYFRDRSENEVGGFGITEPDDLLFVTKFITVKQEVTCVSVRFDDEAVSRFFDEQVDLGRKPEQFARIWLHSHPGDSPDPSSTDEQTFKRVFGSCQWAVMCIVGQDDSTYARLSFNVGPGGQMLIPSVVDYSGEFGPSDRQGWEAEYLASIRPVDLLTGHPVAGEATMAREQAGVAPACDLLAGLEKMAPAERQLVLEELAERPELWNSQTEEFFL